MKSKTTMTAIALVLGLASASAAGAVEWTYSDLDSDGNLEVTRTEFDRVGRDAYNAWDRNGDRRLDDDELSDGIFGAWDGDRNGRLSRQEYFAGFDSWFPDADRPAFNRISGGDEALTRDEFANGFARNDALERFDSQAGFSDGLFDAYDSNRDDVIGQNEYNDFDFPLAGVERTGVRRTGNAGRNAIHTNAIALSDWNVDRIYAGGISVNNLFDETEVYGPTGEEIGDVENVVFADDGRVLSLIAEVGGFWDLFDTHVSVPWDQVRFANGDVIIPVTEDNVEDYDVFETDYLTADEAAGNTRVVEDTLRTGPQAFRATELIGDFARIRDGGSYIRYGYIDDLVIRNGDLAAVVVEPRRGYGVDGRYAYPYEAGGFTRFSHYYDMPYDRNQAAEATRFDADRVGP